MIRKPVIILAAILAASLGLAAYLLRPITVNDGLAEAQVRAPVLRVGQALSAAQVVLYQGDLVSPGLEEWVPFDGQITITRALHLTIWDTGQIHQISAPSEPLGALLEQAGVALKEGDAVLWNGQPLDTSAPPPAPIMVVQVDRARTVQVTSGEEMVTLHTRAQTAAQALWEAGIRPAPADWISVDPGAAPPVDSPIGYQAARSLTITAGGQQASARTTARTVGQALADAGITLQGLDYSQPAEDQPLPEDGQIRVVRVREEINLQETLVPFESNTAPDPELDLDQRRTMVAGRYGVKVVRERARFEDGQEVSRGFDSDWVASEPVARTIGYGTRVTPKTTDTPDGTIEYYREMRVYATSYSPCRLGTSDGRCGNTTASGQPLKKGMIAVTLAWYRQLAGQRVYVPGYGFGVIADVGGGIPGTPWIDLGFEDHDFQGIVGWVTMYFLTPAPANVPWALP